MTAKNSFLREYVRDILGEDDYVSRTQFFFEKKEINEFLDYDPDTVWDECVDLTENKDKRITEDYYLRSFARDVDGSVIGASWVETSKNKFRFLTIAEDKHEYLHKDLIQDCLEEYDYLLDENKDLIIEVLVSDKNIQSLLEQMDFRVIREYSSKIKIMGIDES